MAPPTGNKFWEARIKHGRGKKFETPQDLFDSCAEYFQWIEENPIWSVKPMNSNGEIVDHPVQHPRVMTIRGLCSFLDISPDTWSNYKHRDNYSDIVGRIEGYIYDYKLAGAAAGLFNANIIARELGLKEAGTVEHTGKDGGAIKTEDVSDRDLGRRMAFLLAKGVKADDASG